MNNSHHTNDLLATFYEEAERLKSQSTDFRKNIRDFETATQGYDSEVEVFETAIAVFERAAQDLRKAAQNWGTANRSIKRSTNKFKRDAMNFDSAIPKFFETFKHLLEQPTRSGIEMNHEINGHTEYENSFIDGINIDEPKVNGGEPKAAVVRMRKNGLNRLKKGEKNDDVSSTEHAMNRKGKNKEKQHDDGTSREASKLQSQAQAQSSNKLKRTATKQKTNSEPKPKLRKRATRMAAILQKVDMNNKTKKGIRMQQENSTGINKKVKNVVQAEEKPLENDKETKRTFGLSTDEHAKDTIMSTSSTANSSIQPIFKNIDPEKHANHTVHQKICLFCDTESNQLVSHYVKQHPEYEVPITRPAPKMAALLRSHEETFTIAADVIEGICYFCAKVHKMPRSHWEEHYLSHTAESSSVCSDCNTNPARKNDHDQSCLGKVNSTDASLMGFICIHCNYLKVHLSAIQKHLKAEHGLESDKEVKHYEKVLLVPDLSSLPTDDMNKYAFVQAVNRFRCTICNKQTKGTKDFMAHISEMHKGIQQYDCLCGERIPLRDEQLAGKVITDHLSKHSNDLYLCSGCVNLYAHKKDIRNHMIQEHPEDEIKYKHLYRSNDQKLFVAETMVRKFECKMCRTFLVGTFANLFDHFRAKHQSDKVDVTLFASKKWSYLGVKPNGIDTKYSDCIQSNIQFKI